MPRTGHLMKVTCCARGGTTCRFFQRPAVRISPGSRSLLPSLGSGSPKLVTLVRSVQSWLLLTWMPPSRHSLSHWMNLSSPEERKSEAPTCAFAFSGQLWQGLLWLLEWRLSDIRYPGPLLPLAALLLGKCINNTHPGLFLLVDYGSLG